MASHPSHRIHRVEIEIEVGAVEHGRALIERLSQLQSRRIAPLIDRVCSELSGPDRHDRIDELELELGTIALDEFDDGFMRALEAALRSALARRLGSQTRERPETAALELLESFARTGNLPWWAEREREGLIAEQLRVALDSAPERWSVLLRSLADDPVALARLATHCAGPQLEMIAAKVGLAPERVTELRELEHWIIETGVFGLARVAELRVRSAWLAALGHGGAARGVPLPEVLAELIGLAPIVIGPLRRAIRASAAAGPEGAEEPRGSTPAWLLVAAASVLGGTISLRTPRGAEPPREHEGTPLARANPAIPPGSASAEQESEIEESENHEPEIEESDIREPEIEESENHEPEIAESEIDEPEIEESEIHEPEIEESDIHEPDESLDPVLPQSESPRGRAPDRPAPERPADPARQAARRRALDRLETLYVDDAGLVILWPFLDRFFLRAGLLDLDRRFIDEQATMQAIALLSQLAVEDPDPPEFRLPLAKLLCGRSPEDAFVLERALVPEQLDECERLLASVIHNAPILRDTSVASFRANFVQRPAALTIREGAWLLEVEERPHDLVLDRVPWSWSWVKLAWMADPLFVRW